MTLNDFIRVLATFIAQIIIFFIYALIVWIICYLLGYYYNWYLVIVTFIIIQTLKYMRA